MISKANQIRAIQTIPTSLTAVAVPMTLALLVVPVPTMAAAFACSPHPMGASCPIETDPLQGSCDRSLAAAA